MLRGSHGSRKSAFFEGEEIARWVRKARDESSYWGEEANDAVVREELRCLFLRVEELADRTPGELRWLTERVFLALRRDLYFLEEFSRDPKVTEIMVNGPSKIFIEREGRLIRTELFFEDRETLVSVIRRLAANVGREINEVHPIVDARTEEGYRVNAVYHNVALDGPILTIRKFPESAYTMEDLVRFGTLPEACAVYLEELVRRRYNLFVSGGTATGKTTLLNALSGAIPGTERVVVIEDSAELKIEGVEDLVRMESHGSGGEGRGHIPMEELIRASLRMRPDRIIVGEVRGKEVVDMINAMNTGHDGSLSTGHGNSVRGMVRRLESMFLQGTGFPLPAIRSQIAEGIDIMVHLRRMSDGRRFVSDVTELFEEETGEIGYNPLFSWDPATGLTATGNPLLRTEKWKTGGRS